MPALTRRRDPDARQETWRIYCGDVHVGTLGLRSGNPTTTDQWQWHCGFYPGSPPGETSSGTAATFWEARTAFETAWRIFLAKRTEADFLAWRDHRDTTAQKYALYSRDGKGAPGFAPSRTLTRRQFPSSYFRRNPTQHVPENAVLYLKRSWTLPPDVRFDG
jgi:hypothetical protein